MNNLDFLSASYQELAKQRVKELRDTQTLVQFYTSVSGSTFECKEEENDFVLLDRRRDSPMEFEEIKEARQLANSEMVPSRLLKESSFN